MVQEATIAPITLLPSEVRAALPHILCQQLLQCSQGYSSPVVWEWVWPGCMGWGTRGFPSTELLTPVAIAHVTGGGEASQQWDGSVALTVSIPVLPPALLSPATGKFWLPN